MKKLIYIAAITASFLLGGCAIGNQYDYHSAELALPVKGNTELGLAVVDNRDYVKSGEKDTDFVGLQRGGFGNPFNVTTKSGQPLATDWEAAIKKALEANGFDVSAMNFSSADHSVKADVVGGSGKTRNVIVTINEWKTDIYMNYRLLYDLSLQVLDQDGSLLAKSEIQGDETIGGGGFEGQNSRTAQQAFERKVGRLFNDQKVAHALAQSSS